MRHFSRAAFACAAAIAIAACGDATLNVVFGPDPLTTDPHDAAVGDDDAPHFLNDGAFVLPDGHVTNPQDFCKLQGPIRLPSGTCTGDIGKKTFLFASCSCGDTEISGALRTDAVTSLDASAGGGTIASVGTNGSFRSTGQLSLGGSLFSAGGSPAVGLHDEGTIANDIRAGGPIEVDGTFTVGGDVYAKQGSTLTSGSLTCGGKIHAATGTPTPGMSADGGFDRTAFNVPEPCQCDKLLDVAATVAAFQSANEDANFKVTPLDLAASGAHDESLPCGHFYFDGMVGDVTIHLTGRTAIFIAGDASVGNLTLDLATGAEVDLFIAKSFHIDGSFQSNAPASKVRIYVGGSSFTISGTVGSGANVYAPNAVFQAASAFEMTGSLFARQLQFSGDFTIHYDPGILDTQGCDTPGSACDTCHDCAGATPACKGGTCVACTVNDDCCAPLVCHGGSCVPDIR